MNKLDFYLINRIYEYLETLEDKRKLMITERYLTNSLMPIFIKDFNTILTIYPNKDWLFLTFIKNEDYYGIKLISREISYPLLLDSYLFSFQTTNKKLYDILLPLITYFSIIYDNPSLNLPQKPTGIDTSWC